MLVHKTISVAEAWNTWSERPAELVFLPLGVRIAPVLYSAKERRATTIRAPEEIRFGRHGLAGDPIEFQTRFAGTRVDFAYRKPDPFVIDARWNLRKSGEWGLRHWIVLCLSAEGGETVRFDATSGAAIVSVGGRFVALVAKEAPVLVTGHGDVDGLLQDFDINGYFDKSTRAERAPMLALRFNLEMSPDQHFSAAVADSEALAVAKARAVLDGPDGEADPALQAGRHAGALDAVRDVLGWNTLFDRHHRRPTTAASRIWGLGDAVWFNDQCFAALMAGVLDTAAGRRNLDIALAQATPQGNVACLVNPKDDWVDRSQAPHGAFVAWTMYLRSRERSLLDDAFEPLARNQLWWRTHRDPDGRGLVSCGTSDLGDAMYRGTAFGARNESGMDNSPTHDEAIYDAGTRTLSTLDVGLNSALALDAEMLSAMAGELGRLEDAAHFARLAEESRQHIRRELWDETRGLFANRQRGGGFVRSVSPTSFFPLLCGAASRDQAVRLTGHLSDPHMFGGAFGLPNVARSDPAFADDIYWRGRIWPNVNYLVWQGLRRYGLPQADELASTSFALFERSWREHRHCGENYSALTGEIDADRGNDVFYSWGALLPMMAVASVMDVGPWNGWEIDSRGAAVRLGPVISPAGAVVVEIDDAGAVKVENGSGLLFRTTLRGRLRHIRIERGLVSVTFAEGCRGSAVFTLGVEASRRFVVARLDAVALVTQIRDGCVEVDLDDVEPGARLDVHLAPA
ncbi:glycoside hydrolase family 37 [Aureimonas sp. Leaf454]|uniref:MGH1-like glycoside hydrolase domain-containing protein n=1 Tax=Aureimonas sp. Leaf454 TaxID=1736381 RepID=UPI0006F3C54E|nr:trehalase family glycosidase [Aureimonas sp. Leaf454]KQT54279.1 glycoside hydrolase family 37 [Aureimonas sp. Leaf454]